MVTFQCTIYIQFISCIFYGFYLCSTSLLPLQTNTNCLFVLGLLPGYVHELHGSRLAACVFHAPRKTPPEKSHKLVCVDRFPRFRHQSVELGQLYSIYQNQVLLSSSSRAIRCKNHCHFRVRASL